MKKVNDDNYVEIPEGICPSVESDKRLQVTENEDGHVCPECGMQLGDTIQEARNKFVTHTVKTTINREKRL